MEKLRSVYQRARTRANYDIYRLLQQQQFDDQAIHSDLQQKALIHHVDLDLPNGLPEDEIEAVRAYGDKAVDRLVTEHVSFDEMVKDIDRYLQELATGTLE